MKKIILVLIIIFLTTGCIFKSSKYENDTIHYNLTINDHYTENITFTFPKTAYDKAKENINNQYDSLEFILLVDNFSRPIHNNLSSFYEKNITRLKDSIEVELKYEYIEKDFINSNYMTNCFEKHSIIDNDNYLEINLSGEFFCLQDKTITLEVDSLYNNIISNGKLVNNKYQWVINNDNKNNTSIYYKVQRNKNNMLKLPGLLNHKDIDTDKIAKYEYLIVLIVLIVGFFFYRYLYHKEFD